jgi:hypothetical protein
MKRRLFFVAVIAALVLALGLFLFLWPRQPDSPLCLKIVGQTMENGGPTAFFRLEGAENRKIHIGKIERISGEQIEPFDPRGRPGQKFWAPSSPVPMGDPTNPNQGRTQFGVIAPGNAPVWKLRVKVFIEPANEIELLNKKLGLWKLLRRRGDPFFRGLQLTWTVPIYSDAKVIESDPITNTLPQHDPIAGGDSELSVHPNPNPQRQTRP